MATGEAEQKTDDDFLPLKYGGKAFTWLIKNGKVDPLLRLVFCIIFWFVIIYIGQLFAYRKIQVAFFEVPPDRLLYNLSVFEGFQSLKLFPFDLLLAPFGLLVLSPILRFLSQMASKFDQIKGRGWLASSIKIFAFLLLFLLVPAYKFFYKSDWIFAREIFISVMSFSVGAFCLNLTFVDGVQTEESKNLKSSVGLYSLLTLISAFLFGFSVCSLTTAQTIGSQSSKFSPLICSNLTLVSVKADKIFRHGWLISRDSSSILLRELDNDVYRTVEIPIEESTEYIYNKRFGSNEEKSRAFPGCFNSL